MIKIKIDNVEKYWDQGKGKSFTISIAPGYTCLVGPNGTGKTTMLRQIRDTLKHDPKYKDDYKVVYHDNMRTNGSQKYYSFLMTNQINKLAESYSSSEGEQIVFNLAEFASECGKDTTEAIKENKKLVILIDGVDSGTSIDKIYNFKEQFCGTIINLCKNIGLDVYIISTANNYAMIDEMNDSLVDCIVSSTGKHRSFRGYNDFKKFILKNAK